MKEIGPLAPDDPTPKLTILDQINEWLETKMKLKVMHFIHIYKLIVVLQTAKLMKLGKERSLVIYYRANNFV